VISSSARRKRSSRRREATKVQRANDQGKMQETGHEKRQSVILQGRKKSKKQSPERWGLSPPGTRCDEKEEKDHTEIPLGRGKEEEGTERPIETSFKENLQLSLRRGEQAKDRYKRRKEHEPTRKKT